MTLAISVRAKAAIYVTGRWPRTITGLLIHEYERRKVMSQANQMVCWGNLTRDPELRYFENGSAVCNTGVAINKTWTDPQGKKQESTEFFDLSIWGKMGENVAESLGRGDRVVVVGSLKIRRVEGDDGSKKQFPEINVEEIGPTLRWSTTTQAKNLKDNNGKPAFTPTHAAEPEF